MCPSTDPTPAHRPEPGAQPTSTAREHGHSHHAPPEAAPPKPTAEGKNIVVCLDGTNNQLRAAVNTNVVRLFNLLDLSDPTAQVAYYDPGVGTFSSPAAWSPPARAISRWAGLLFGAGLRQNLAEAYSFLISNYQPGDKIFIFGFSRGAYTARALTGMLDVFGVFRPTSQNLVPYAISAYTKQQRRQPKHQHDVDDERRDDASKQYFQLLRTYATQHDIHGTGHTPVHFVGLWDTVKSAGTLTRQLRWPFTRQLPHARTIRHAISIEENRRPFAPYRLRTADPGHLMVDTNQDLLEVWFAGIHSDVGGKYPTGTQLSDIALKWMADEAVDADLIVRPKRYAHMSLLDGVDPAGPPHTNCILWRLLGPGRRTPPNDALIHASVQQRADTDPEFRRRLPPSPTYVCQDWRTPRKPLKIHTEQIRPSALLENAGSAD